MRLAERNGNHGPFDYDHARSYFEGNIDVIGGIDFADVLLLADSFGKVIETLAVPEPVYSIATWILVSILARRRDTGRRSRPRNEPSRNLCVAALMLQLLAQRCRACPTVGKWMMGTLEREWADYVAFHIEKLGCRFCRANQEDLREDTEPNQVNATHQRIMQSSVAFFSHAVESVSIF